MLYRPLGTSGLDVSILGFGCMRLPVIDDRQDMIDEPAATDMLRYAIENGVNYVDTAFPYHGTSRTEPGASEGFVGRALRGGYRDRVHLATKMPSWLVETRDDMDRILGEQLERLQTDHLDVYLLHALKAQWWEKLQRLGVLEFLDRAKADGRIGHAAFSFHDAYESLPPIVDAYDWAFCQLQYNYLDVDEQAGTRGVRHAAEHGLGVVVMEPLRGGRLAPPQPPDVEAVWERAAHRRTPVEWALRFVWDDPAVGMALSGMSEMSHVVDNIAIANAASDDPLTEEDLGLIAEVREVYRSRAKSGCTGCKYCMPCTSGIDIPRVLALLNKAAMYDDFAGVKARAEAGVLGRAARCSYCGACEGICPQHLKIRDLLEEATELFDV